MRITPLDIRKQPFRKKMVGFDPDEVNSFLEMVAAEFENVIKQNDELATQVKQREQKLETYVKIEKTLNDTLLTAQKATDDARMNAQKEAELILRDAQVRADKYEDDSRHRVHQLESELVALRNQRDSFLARFQSMLKTQLGLLSIISGDLQDTNETSTRAPLNETMAEVPPQPLVSSLDV
ncbi:MAG: DivIVA domain-containing protein [Chitinivibrionales bacterium]|nr:DivIVA domain-containing protein [Chitinivibrionales bacterium]